MRNNLQNGDGGKQDDLHKESVWSGQGAWLLLVVMMFLGGVLAVYFFVTLPSEPRVQEEPQSVVVEKTQEELLDEQVDSIVSAMTLPQKVGQLVMIGVQGTEIDDYTRYILPQFYLGGVILFDRNMESAEQTKAMIAQLQQAANNPLFIAVDEEGGLVVRGKDFISPPPSQEEIAGSGQVEAARDWAANTGKVLKELGFNINFAPVADIGAAYGRTYGGSAGEVLPYLRAAVAGYEQAGIMYALKHFPGIGRSEVDSHYDISVIEATEKELMQEDVKPFAEIISSGDKGSKMNYMVMVGHLKYAAFDADNPASQSPKIITELLRHKLGYQGIIITDDLEMGAIANHQNFREAGAKAIAAGADMALICHEYDHEEEVYLGILEAVQSGAISAARLDESVKRVVKAKLLHGLKFS